jgi:hypothetical protein
MSTLYSLTLPSWTSLVHWISSGRSRVQREALSQSSNTVHVDSDKKVVEMDIHNENVTIGSYPKTEST